jgi:rhodanese-related sulfurtransferase
MNLFKNRRAFINILIVALLLGLATQLIRYGRSSGRVSLLQRPPLTSPPERERPASASAASVEGQLLKPAEVKKILIGRRERVVIVDIQKRDRFRQAHIPSAVNIPSDELEVRAEDELSKSDFIIIVDCACDGTNNESLIRREALLNLGFKNVAVLDEGVDGWKRATFYLITEQKPQD